MGKDLEAEIDRLYRLPLAEFTAERNELSKRLRGEKEREAADRVKKLAKPTLTAWAVNQLQHRASEEMAAFTEASDALRQAYVAGAEERRRAQATRRRAQAALLDVAEEILREAGTEPGRDHRQRMANTLEALVAGGDDLPPPGRLTRDLEPPGFEALAGLAPTLEQALAERRKRPQAVASPARRKTAKKTKKKPEPERETEPEKEPAEVVDFAARRRRTLDRKLAQAREALAELEERHAERQGQEAADRKELEAVEKAAAEAAAEAEEAERRAHEARERAEKARAGLAGPRRRVEAAAAALRRTEAELEKARAEVDELAAQRAELSS